MIFNQVLGFFQNNKKKTSPSKQTLPPSPTVVASATSSPSVESSFTSSGSKNEQVPTPSLPSPPPHNTSTGSDIQIAQVEFEQSRSLLQLDFFGPDQQQLGTNFPQFDYLLCKPPPSATKTPKTEEQKTKLGTLNRKLTNTLRHRISTYRPSHGSKQVKRSTSSPNLA